MKLVEFSVAGSGVDAAGGRGVVDRDQGLLGRVDALAGVVRRSTWSVAIGGVAVERRCWRRCGSGVPVGRPALGAIDVADVALAAAGAVLGRQEAGQDVGRQLTCRDRSTGT